MGHRFSVGREGRLLIVTFEGEIAPEEEQRALLEVAQVPGLLPTADVLVDRRLARTTVGPEHVGPQVDLARSKFPTEGRPRMALVVTADYDFGMMRMLELRGADELPHEMRVFRSLDDACAWLGLEPDDVAALDPA
jgi:hypothetical protein